VAVVAARPRYPGVKPQVPDLIDGHPLASGLVAAFVFHEGGGLVTRTVRGEDVGVLTDGAIWRVGALGSSISFDGTNDHVLIAHSPRLAVNAADLSIVAMVNPTNFSTFRGILGKTVSNIPASYDYYLVATSGLPRLFRGDGVNGAPPSVTGNVAVATGRWSHVAVTMQGTNVRHFLNGLDNGSGTLSTTMADTGANVRIGSRADNATPFIGEMAFVYLYNRALTPAEIQQLYISPYSIFEAPRRFWFGQILTRTQEGFRWRNDDGSETTATWKANQDTNVSFGDIDTPIRLRVLTDTSSDAPSEGVKLQYRKVGDPDWLDVGPQ